MSHKQTSHQRRVEQFMRTIDAKAVDAGFEAGAARRIIPIIPAVPDEETRLCAARLIAEESAEAIRELGFDMEVYYPQYHGTKETGLPVTKAVLKFIPNHSRELTLGGIADGCGDTSVVVQHTLLVCGIWDRRILEAIDGSNLAKFSGDAHFNDQGKWVKPSDWTAPNLQAIVESQIRDYVGGNGR